MNPLTKMEIIYIQAMSKSCFNDRPDDYKNGGVWQWSVTDEITEFTVDQARGVLSSLVKKGFVVVDDYEGRGRSNDMIVTLTEKGIEAEKEIQTYLVLKEKWQSA